MQSITFYDIYYKLNNGTEINTNTTFCDLKEAEKFIEDSNETFKGNAEFFYKASSKKFYKTVAEFKKDHSRKSNQVEK